MKHLSSLVFLLLNFRLHTFAIPVDSGIRDGDMQLAKSCFCVFFFCQKYLNDFYSPDPSALLLSYVNNNDSMTEKLKEMQRFFRLKVTGKVDAETLQVMRMPRCGVSDVAEGHGKWQKNHLTYRIWNYPLYLEPYSVYQAFQKAFQVWSNVTPLTFQELSRDSDADITISFAYGGNHTVLSAMVIIALLMDLVGFWHMPLRQGGILKEKPILMLLNIGQSKAEV
ncbi:hypothetical protein lerEdw1_005918, partial [Lerista edwardsae]